MIKSIIGTFFFYRGKSLESFVARFSAFAKKHEILMRKLSETEGRMLKQLHNQQEEIDQLLCESREL